MADYTSRSRNRRYSYGSNRYNRQTGKASRGSQQETYSRNQGYSNGNVRNGYVTARDIAELVRQITNLMNTINNMVVSMQAMIELVKELIKKEEAKQNKNVEEKVQK